MNIIVKKNYLYIDQFKLKCALGKGGIIKNKVEGDGCTPKGKYKIGDLFYRKDKVKKLKCLINKRIIKKNFAWCDDSESKFYNRLVKLRKKNNFNFEKLFRKDFKYNYLIPIKYNFHNTIKNKGSAIFIHLTKDYKPTKGCIALKEKDFVILSKLISKKTNISIV